MEFQIENVSDDAVVDAVAKRGRAGAHMYDQSMEKLLMVLWGESYADTTRQEIYAAAYDLRWYATRNFHEWPTLANRLMVQGPTLHLTDEEWSKRLAGKTAGEILAILQGAP